MPARRVTDGGARLQAAATRALRSIPHSLHGGDGGGDGGRLRVLRLQVHTPDDGASPRKESRYDYTLRVNGSAVAAVGSAHSVFGAMYALESFSQLVNGSGYLPCAPRPPL